MRKRVAAAEERAEAAEQLADEQREQAIKGRALAAALQAADTPSLADLPESAVRHQQADLARGLFGELVARRTSIQN
jgi:hypothetical protein